MYKFIKIAKLPYKIAMILASTIIYPYRFHYKIFMSIFGENVNFRFKLIPSKHLLLQN